MSRVTVPSEASPQRRALNILLVVLAVLGYEGLMHWSMVSASGDVVASVCALAPLAGLIGWILWRQSRAAFFAGVAIALVLLAVVRARHALPDLKLLYPAPQLCVYAVLLWFFGRTLRPGREPLVTLIARHVHGALPEEIEVYTRRVTWAWCIFFVMMAATSIALFAFAPLRVWSWFANVFNIPLVLFMFAVEYIYRVLRFPSFSHASFLTAIRVFRDLGRAAVMPGR